MQSPNKLSVDINFDARLPGYRLKRCIGDGCGTKVRLAEDAGTLVKVAVKFPDEKSECYNLAKIFENEAATLTLLRHPHVLGLVEYLPCAAFVRTNGTHVLLPALVYELADLDLFTLINETGRLSLRLTFFFLRQLVDALAYIHSKKIAHLDIKPQNVLLFFERGLLKAKLGDFGSSVWVNDGSYLKGNVGTVGFQAPELCQGKKFDGEKADLFALGVTFFEMVTGVPPFSKAEPSDVWYKLFVKENAKYWQKLSEYFGPGVLTREFAILANRLMCSVPEGRGTFASMQNDDWYKASVADSEPVLAEDIKEEMIARCRLLVKGKEPK